MYGQVVQIDAQLERGNVHLSDLSFSASDSLQLSYQPTAHHVVKGIRGDVPEQTIRIRQIFTNFRQRDFAGVALTLQGPQSPRRLLL